MVTQAEIVAAARALAYKARREHAPHEDAMIYADMCWKQWADSAKAALEAAESFGRCSQPRVTGDTGGDW